jgi:hypothetical protein
LSEAAPVENEGSALRVAPTRGFSRGAMILTPRHRFTSSGSSPRLKSNSPMNDKRILLTLILFIGGYFIFRSFHDAHRSQAATLITGASSEQNQHGDALPTPGPSSPATPLVHASFRPLNFALLRGGFSSVNEFFERVHDDPVLHDFYGDCADRNATMFPLPEDITAFSTFRKGDNIKWAQKPLLIKKGEYVITFCGKTVLARCGTLISVSPMQPSEDVPPALLEAPSEPAEAPLTLVADAAPTSADPVGAAAVPAAAANSRRFFFVPPFYIPQGGSHSTPPPTIIGPVPPPSGPPPPPPGQISGDEFSGHQALFTLFIGLFVIALLRLTTR